MPQSPSRHAWRLLLAELAGTGLLVAIGLSIVILDTSPEGPIAPVLDPQARLALTGFLFGSIGALIAVSPIGKASGAHINPVVTLAFVARGHMRPSLGAGYVLAQLAGAVLGAAPLLAWGATGRRVDLGATVPGAGYGPLAALGGEVATSAALIVLLFAFVGNRRLRAFTPLLFPPLYAIMVLLEAPVSGTSTNPARSLGPAVVAGVWRGWWVYWAGPVLGALVGVAITRLHPLRTLEVETAKVYHFEIDRHGLLTDVSSWHLPTTSGAPRPRRGGARSTPASSRSPRARPRGRARRHRGVRREARRGAGRRPGS